KSPVHGKPRHQQNGRHHYSTQSQRQSSGDAQREFTLHQITREPAPEKTANPGGGVGNPRVRAHRFDVEPAGVIEVFWKPEEVKVPGGIAQEFGAYQPPGLTNT